VQLPQEMQGLSLHFWQPLRLKVRCMVNLASMPSEINRTKNCEIHACIVDGLSIRRKHDSFRRAELEDSAKGGCRLCQLLCDALGTFTDLQGHSTVTNDGQFSKRRYAMKTAAWTSRVLELYALPGAIACD
jgi:hypothetical protein